LEGIVSIILIVEVGKMIIFQCQDVVFRMSNTKSYSNWLISQFFKKGAGRFVETACKFSNPLFNVRVRTPDRTNWIITTVLL